MDRPIDIDHLFRYHKPTEAIGNIHDRWRDEFLGFASNVETLPDTRERSIAMTKLEECSFWVHACIARNHDKFDGQT